MPEHPAQETWLLLDAAGPDAIVGLVQADRWLDQRRHSGDFLEWFQPAIESMLQDNRLALADVAGVLYAAGPGSTLGLRLAAMFCRSLMQLPGFAHWRCLQYNNLELALAAARLAGNTLTEAVAPWRRDRFHHVVVAAGESTGFQCGHVTPGEAEARRLTGFILGRRPANAAAAIDWKPYPHQDIPRILNALPQLLQVTASPAPYAAEDPEFARWTAQRHTAP